VSFVRGTNTGRPSGAELRRRMGDRPAPSPPGRGPRRGHAGRNRGDGRASIPQVQCPARSVAIVGYSTTPSSSTGVRTYWGRRPSSRSSERRARGVRMGTTGRTACGGDARPREGKESLSPNEDRRRDRTPAASDRGKPEVHTQRVELVFCFVQYSQAMVTCENRGSSSRTAATVRSPDRHGARPRPARVPRASRVAATRAIPARTTRNRPPALGTAPIVERARSDTGRR
jgi:hypothetical protein